MAGRDRQKQAWVTNSKGAGFQELDMKYSAFLSLCHEPVISTTAFRIQHVETEYKLPVM